MDDSGLDEIACTSPPFWHMLKCTKAGLVQSSSKGSNYAPMGQGLVLTAAVQVLHVAIRLLVVPAARKMHQVAAPAMATLLPSVVMTP